MTKTILPNARFLALKSEHLGKDWSECVQQIDANLDALGMDLAHESIYLLFDRSPGAVLATEGEVAVARPVVGPKRGPMPPLKLVDWVQAPVYRQQLTSAEWVPLLEECLAEWERLQQQGIPLAAAFMLEIKKRLTPQLEVTIDVLFHE